MKDAMKIINMSLMILDVLLAALKDAKNALLQPNVLYAKKEMVTIWMKEPKHVSQVSQWIPGY